MCCGALMLQGDVMLQGVSPDSFHRKDFDSLGVTHFLYLLDIFYFFKENGNRL